MPKNNQNTITDKELLAICNLSNLQLEFADTVKDREKKLGKFCQIIQFIQILKIKK